MGEYAEMVIDGVVCQECGEPIDNPIGCPTTCRGCRSGADDAPPFKPQRKRSDGPRFDAFSAACEAVGMVARYCHETHWQIIGGKNIVNFWPTVNKFKAEGKSGKAMLGDYHAAIKSAGAAVRKAIADPARPMIAIPVDCPTAWDTYAAHALGGILASTYMGCQDRELNITQIDTITDMAMLAADLMLAKKRERGEQ